MSLPLNPWKTVSSRVIYQNKWLTLYHDDVINPVGKPTTYTYTKQPPFVMIIARNNDQFVFVRQYRYPLQQEMIELPGGGIDDGESPLEAARRELAEEAGLTAAKWIELGTFYQTNRATVFLAEELTDTGQHKMADDGIAEVMNLSRKDIDRLIAAGKFSDSKTLSSLFLFARYRAQTSD